MKLSVLLVTAMALSACGIQNGASGMQDGGAASLRLQQGMTDDEAITAIGVPPSKQDGRAASLRLEQGMTEDEAINAIGVLPSKADMIACGTKTKQGAWSCKILYFDTIPQITVVEANVKGTWVVNGWKTK